MNGGRGHAALAADPVFTSSSVQLLPTGTLLRIPHPAALSIALTQLQQGWRIAALRARQNGNLSSTSAADGHINLAAEQPSEVVNIADSDTGAPYWWELSTALAKEFDWPGIVRNSSCGQRYQEVVVEALSDAKSLKPTPTGFSLSGPAAGLSLSPPTGNTAELIDAAHLTRRLNFSTMPADTLRRLAITQFDDAAHSPPLSPGPQTSSSRRNLSGARSFRRGRRPAAHGIGSGPTRGDLTGHRGAVRHCGAAGGTAASQPG